MENSFVFIERFADTFIVVAMSLVAMTNLTCLLLLSVSSLMNLEMPKNYELKEASPFLCACEEFSYIYI